MEMELSTGETEQKFVDAILSVMGGRIARGEINRQTHLIIDLSMSSIELLNLIIACEREIGVSPVDGDNLDETFSTVGRAVDALHRMRAAKVGAKATSDHQAS